MAKAKAAAKARAKAATTKPKTTPKPKPKARAKAQPEAATPAKRAARKSGRAALDAAIDAVAHRMTLATLEVAVTYRRGTPWDAEAGRVETRPGELVGLPTAVPTAWSSPLQMPDGTVAFYIDDAFVILRRVRVGDLTAPDLDRWVEIRRGQIPDDWLIVGHRVLEHPTGLAAYETLELSAVETPPKIRAVRVLFTPDDIVHLMVVTPGPIPPERGRELAACFNALRPPR